MTVQRKERTLGYGTDRASADPCGWRAKYTDIEATQAWRRLHPEQRLIMRVVMCGSCRAWHIQRKEKI